MVRKYTFFIANTIIIVFICVAFFVAQISELSFYKEMAAKQARNDVRLTALDIDSNITSFVSEQIVITQMMSNDAFIRQWCREETGETTGPHVYQLYSYLSEYKNKYGYDCVFFVSDATRNFYYDGGFHKTLDPDGTYDSWYQGFLGRHLQFDTQIDTDELNNDRISLFVNGLVQDKGFKTLGVIGVSKNIEGFQKKIASYEKEYGVTICVVNVGESYNSFKGSFDYYMQPEEAAEFLGLTNEQVAKEVAVDEAYTWFDDNKCTNIIYNPKLDWNIIVQKDISETVDSIMVQTNKRFGLILVFVLIYAIVSTTLLSRLNLITRRAENTDDLTGLFNNKIFKEIFEKKRKRLFVNKNTTLFMIDVDDFKLFNDNYGHLYGNTILKLVADGLKEYVGNEGIVARWGGDEFIGVVYASELETELLIRAIMDELKRLDTHKTVTLSCGIVQVDPHLNLEKNMSKADEALYESKTNGKSCCTVYKKK